jgi:hypothetical protein
MNERIRELWSQAGGQYNSGNQHTWPEYTIDDPKKFTELIVRECVDIIDKDAELPDDIGGNAYLRMASKKIKQHFGVEE